MKNKFYLIPMLAVLFTLSACGGEEAQVEDTDTTVEVETIEVKMTSDDDMETPGNNGEGSELEVDDVEVDEIDEPGEDGVRADEVEAADFTDEDKEVLIAGLAIVAEFAEGESDFAPWEFTDVTLDGTTWTVDVVNTRGEDSITFDYDGPVLEDGAISFDWMAGLGFGIEEWETANAE